MEPPNEEDCCNSGCNPCIFDVYEENLKKIRDGEHNLKTPTKNCISQTSYAIFKLVAKEKCAENAFFMIFKYVKRLRDEKIDNENLRLCFDPGQHFLIKSSMRNSEEFTRAYTPLLDETLEKLQFKIIVKIYEDGLMSKILKNLKIGRETLWRGPYGDFNINYGNYKNILGIAQGTGIAPIYSILCKILEDENFESFFQLFYCCKSFEEIFLRDELHSMLKYWNFKCEIFLGDNKKGNEKYNEIIHYEKLSEKNILNYLKNKKDVRILICGSENFSGSMLSYLKGINKEDIYVF